MLTIATQTVAAAPAWPVGRDAIEHHIQHVWTLAQYIAFVNRDVPAGQGGIFDDVAMWAEDGITTAAQLADYLDGCCTRNVQKSEMYG